MRRRLEHEVTARSVAVAIRVVCVSVVAAVAGALGGPAITPEPPSAGYPLARYLPKSGFVMLALSPCREGSLDEAADICRTSRRRGGRRAVRCARAAWGKDSADRLPG